MLTISQGSTFHEKSRLNFELLISEISSSLIQPSDDEIDSTINSSLQKILDFMGIDRAALFQEESPGSKRLILTHVKIRPGCGPQEKPYLTTDSFPWMIKELSSGRETKYSRIDDIQKKQR